MSNLDNIIPSPDSGDILPDPDNFADDFRDDEWFRVMDQAENLWARYAGFIEWREREGDAFEQSTIASFWRFAAMFLAYAHDEEGRMRVARTERALAAKALFEQQELFWKRRGARVPRNAA